MSQSVHASNAIEGFAGVLGVGDVGAALACCRGNELIFAGPAHSVAKQA